MKSLTQYTYSCTNAIFEFLKDSNSEKLISKLKNIEIHAKNSIANSDLKSLWFKFGSDDVLAIDIKNIEIDLALPVSHGNRKLMIENFEMVTEDINPYKELRVFFA